MVMFLPLPDLTKFWGTWGAPCAGSPGLSPLRIEPCLLCCWLWLFSGDAQWDQIYVTAKLECWFPCLGITASWCDGLRAHRALELHYLEGKQVSVILNGMCFCQNRLAISLGKWINTGICVHFYLNSYAAENAAKNLLAVPQILGVLGDHAFRNPAAGFPREDRRNGWFWNGGNAIPLLSALTLRSISWLTDDRKAERKLMLMHMQLTVQTGVCAGCAAECPVPVPAGTRPLLLGHRAGWQWLK